MGMRSFVGSCLVGLASAAGAAAQVVVLSPPVPILIPAPIPIVEVPVAQTPPAGTVEQRRASEVRQYPKASETPPQRGSSPVIVHERHYLSANTSVSHYMSTQPTPTYGPETRVVIRDFYITDEPAKKTGASSPPPPVGTSDEKGASTPKNSTDAALNDMLDRPKTGTGSSPVRVPPPGPADAATNGNSSTTRQYGPPAPANLLDQEVATMVALASRNGGTPMADMELDFVDLAGKHPDAKGRTDGKGELQARLAPSRWQVYVVFGDNERRSLGVILVKPTAGDPFKLQF